MHASPFRRSPTARAGLVVAGLLGLGDAVLVLTTDGEHPPMAVALLGTVLGLVTLAALVPAWRGSRAAVGAVVVTRAVSALAAVPAFFAGAPTPIVAVAAAGIALTLVAVGLLVPTLVRRPALV
jgi:hypothetical protein